MMLADPNAGCMKKQPVGAHGPATHAIPSAWAKYHIEQHRAHYAVQPMEAATATS
ncbi:hypothetical protein ACVIGA_006168 [Bradyrhizobium sp. USDA 3240]